MLRFNPVVSSNVDQPSIVTLEGGRRMAGILHTEALPGELFVVTSTVRRGAEAPPDTTVYPVNAVGEYVGGAIPSWVGNLGSEDSLSDLIVDQAWRTFHQSMTSIRAFHNSTVGFICALDGSNFDNGKPTGCPAPFTGAEVTGNTLTLTFLEELDGGQTVSTADFEVSVEGTVVSLSSISLAADYKVTLTLTSGVLSGEEVTVSYVRPSTEANTLKYDSGKYVSDFTDQTVTNTTI